MRGLFPGAAALGFLGAMLVVPGAEAGDPTPQEMAAADSAAFEEARAVAATLGKTLMKELLAALEKGGPPAAISVCADSAQTLTARLSSEAVSVRRVSRKFRNPANAPDSLEATWLELLEHKAKEGAMPEEMTAKTIRLGGDGSREIRYMRPIVMAEPCLKCHGDPKTLSPEVRRVLAERYPKDLAVGYAVGDFRGGISVRMRLPAGK